MSNVPKLRFSEFTDSWKETPLRDVTKINQGLQIPIANRLLEQVTGSYFYITNEFLKAGSVKKYYIKSPPESVVCNEKDVLMTRTGNTGQVVTDVAGVFHNNFFKIKYTDDIDKKFLVSFLRLPKTQRIILNHAGTSTIPDLNHGDFYRIKIDLPTLPEQQKIAAFLTVVDTKIEQLTKKEELLKQYKRGVMQKIFSQQIRFKADDGGDYPDWEDKTLGQLTLITAGESKSKYIEPDGDNIVVDMGGVSSEPKLIAHKRTHFSEDFLTVNDLIMPKDDIGGGFIIGKAVRIPNDRKYICGDHVYKLTVQKCDPTFLCYAINSFEVNKALRRKANGTAQLGLNKPEVTKQSISLPSSAEQQKIAAFLTTLDSHIDHVTQQVSAAKAFKKGLLQQMFV